jgi:isopentenyl phosphate kinase
LDGLVFLKLGGSLITDKESPQTARKQIIARAAREIGEALHEAPGLSLVIGHGSGSFGHDPARRYGVQKGLARSESWWGYAETSATAARLNRLVTDVLLIHRVPVVALQPSASALCHDGELVHLETAPLEEALRRGLVPVVYGDVSFDRVRGSAIISTEQIFAYLSTRLEPQRIILTGHVEGVFTGDPLKDPQAHLLRDICASRFAEVERMLTGSHGIDVTGGMLAKVRTMCRLIQAQPSLTVLFISGEGEGQIKRALLDGEVQEGTLLHS